MSTIFSSHFLNDNFSSLDPCFLEPDCPNTMFIAVKQILSEHWNHLGEVKNIEQLVKNKGNSKVDNKHADNSFVYRFQSNHEHYIIKLTAREDVLAQMRQQNRITNELYSLGLPVTPNINSNSNESVVFIESESNFCACVYPYIKGSYFSGSYESTLELSLRMSELASGLDLVGSYYQIDRKRPRYLDKSEISLCNYIIDNKEHLEEKLGQSYAKAIQSNWQSFFECFHTTMSCNDILNCQHSTLTHIDLHPHNILTYDNKVVNFLDFDACYQGHMATTLGFGASKQLKRTVINSLRNRDTDSLPSLLTRYFSNISVVCEKYGITGEILRLFANAESLRRLLSVCRKRLDGVQIVWHGAEVHANAFVENDYIFSHANF